MDKQDKYWIHNDNFYNNYFSRYGVPYPAIIELSSDARKLAEKYNNRISHSQALAWILSGEVPNQLKYEASKSFDGQVIEIFEEELEGLNNEYIKDCIYDTIDSALATGKLSHKYVHSKYFLQIEIFSTAIWERITKLNSYQPRCTR